MMENKLIKRNITIKNHLLNYTGKNNIENGKLHLV